MPRPKAAKAQAAPVEVQAPPAEEAPASQGQEGAAPAKKKRNNNPGVRVQGGRVYDSENGTTCHQCRQKTIETKAKCTKCTLYFCPKCLENRYQEKVEEANATEGWACPRCRGECNCSNCRKKAGKEATGQLAAIAKKAGFGSVRDLLEKNPHAKALQLPKLPPGSGSAGAGGSKASREDSAAAGNEGGEEGGPAAAGAQRKRPAQKRKAAAEEAEKELVPDEQLPPRAAEMPEPRRPAVHKAAAGAAAGSKRPRGGLGWSANVPDAVELPEGEPGAELAAILEFLQVFGSKIGLRSPPLAPLVAELLQPATEDERQLLCSAPADSLVGLVHCRLLEVVRAYWNVKGDVRSSAWQGIMRGYYAATLLTQRQALDLRWQHGPPAVAGEIFSRPVVVPAGEEEAEGAGEAPGPDSMELDGEAVPVLGAGGAAAVTTVDYPAGGYWGLPPAARVAMLHALVHDALETDELRKVIEESMGDAMDEEKERRQQLAGVRKEARAAIQRERDQQIALMIANTATGGLTLEQQQAMLEKARQRAEAAAASAAAAKLKALGEKVHPPTVRAAVVGTDREGRRYLQLQAAPLLTGDGGIVVQSCGPEGPSARCSAGSSGADSSSVEGDAERREAYGCYPAEDMVAVAAALHPQGLREGPLRAALLHAFKLPNEAVAAASGSQGEEQLNQAPPEQQQQGEGEAAAEEEPTVEAEEQQQGEAQPAAATAVSGDGAPAPAGKKGGKGRKRVATAAAAPAEPAGEVAPAPAATKRGAKQAGGRGGKVKTASFAAEAADAPQAAAEPAAAGSKRRRSGAQGSEAEAAPAAGKRQKAAAAPAAADEPAAGKGGRRSARRASPPAAAGKAAGGKAAGRRGRKAAGRRGRKAAEAESAQLPLKVDDMLTA